MIRSLGYVTVAAAGTPVRATANEADPTARMPAQAVSFQARPTNTGLIYIGDRQSMDPATGEGILAILAAPADATTGPFASYAASLPNVPAGINASGLWIDASINGQSVVVGMTQQ